MELASQLNVLQKNIEKFLERVIELFLRNLEGTQHFQPFEKALLIQPS